MGQCVNSSPCSSSIHTPRLRLTLIDFGAHNRWRALHLQDSHVCRAAWLRHSVVPKQQPAGETLLHSSLFVLLLQSCAQSTSNPRGYARTRDDCFIDPRSDHEYAITRLRSLPHRTVVQLPSIMWFLLFVPFQVYCETPPLHHWGVNAPGYKFIYYNLLTASIVSCDS